MHRTSRAWRYGWTAWLAMLACANASHAAIPSADGMGAPVPRAAIFSESEPVMLQSDRLDYDNTHQFIIAEGNVEVTQGDTVLLADTLTYDQQNNLVFAQGNVSVMEPTGNVYFAEDVELTSDMKEGVVANFRARLADDSLLAANQADRINEDVTVMHQAVYSPCSIICDDGEPKTPLWQVRADKATLDRKEQTITYRDASMDLAGVPIFYTPYLSHAMPGADNKSGVLTPEYKHDDNLGEVVKVPFYWAISPSSDMTVTAMYASMEAPVLIGEYRQLFDYGDMKLSGSITQPDDRDATGAPASGRDVRGHFFGKGGFRLSDDWQWGFDIRRTTDDTYLRRYDFNRDPLLTSRIYGEGFDFIDRSGRSYVVAEGLAFQGLQQQDDRRTSPLVLPTVDMFYQTAPMAWNSRLSLSGGMRSLTRDLGADSHRASVSGEWMLPVVTDSGSVFEFATKLRVDGYDVQDYTLPSGLVFDGQEARVLPQASLEWRYPLIKRFERSALIIEPTAMAIVSPNGGNSLKIPNEDSAVPEFTDTNVFSDNRFAGYDRVETGPRINYGLRSQLQILDDKFVDAVLGQSYRMSDDPLFPTTNDLSSRFSDYVGKLGITYNPLALQYRFRMDKDNMEINRSEVQASLSWERFSTSANYLKLKNDPVLGDREELSGGLGIKLTDHWTWTAGGHHDLLRDSLVTTYTGLAFQNECLTVNATAGRSYTSDRDFTESTSFIFQVLLKNLN